MMQWVGLKDRRVLVTGHTGFKGTWLTHWLLQLGAKVCGYALAPDSTRKHFTDTDVVSQIEHTEADIRDFEALNRTMAAFQPEVVFHLAAQPLVRLSYREPRETIETNVQGSVNLMEAVRLCPSVRSLVYVTSDKCYENLEWVWGYRETDRLGGHDPYSASKGAAELLFESYRRSFFQERPDLGVASARAGNVIGGGDFAEDRIVPDAMRALGTGESIGVRNPIATRPWQHVLEPLSGYLTLACALLECPEKVSGAWNFGPESEASRPVSQLVDAVIQAWGSGSYHDASKPGAVHEAGLLHLNCDKAHLELGWRPRWKFDRCIEETVSWYKRAHEGESLAKLTSEQLVNYMESSHD